MKILNFGSLNIDLIYKVERFACPGETLHSLSFEKNIGGKGLNQSVALARGGGEVVHAGNVGADGQFLVDFLQQEGVDTTLIRQVETPTGNAFVQIDLNGQNGILLYGGANQCVTREQIDQVLSHFETGDWLILQNEINLMTQLIERAHQKGMTIVLNPSPVAGCETLPLHLVDYFILNEHESAQLCGKQEKEEIIAALLEQYPQAKFVMTLGGDGSVYFDHQIRHEQGAYPAEIVDTTGAGDTFTGFFFAALTRGESIPRSMELAARAASITITRKGAAPVIPTLEEVLAAE